ncbi:MAG: hypothetical protein IPP69_14770 [Flavobacteriales bacterium]|nr:hypothetical protein [Flavobacteriales bacterium]
MKVNKASTLLPYLATVDMTDEESEHISLFADPVPLRSIGIVVHRHFVKKKIMEILKQDIKDQVMKLLPVAKSTGKKLNPL